MGFEEREQKRKKSVVGQLTGIEVKEEAKDSPAADTVTLKIKPKKELRDRRVQIMLKPSVHDQFKVKAKTLGLSVNELINQLVEGFLDT